MPEGVLLYIGPGLALVRAKYSAGVLPVAVGNERLGDGSAQTVYNLLRSFTGVGSVRRTEPAGQPDLCELHVSDHHHHSVNRRCDPSPMSAVKSATPRA